jgi:hypothetical protein
MAVNAGVRVFATTPNRERFAMLEKLGAERCEIERRDLAKRIPEAKTIAAVLDLVGNTVMLDFPRHASPRRSLLSGRLAWRSRSHPRLQPAAANGERQEVGMKLLGARISSLSLMTSFTAQEGIKRSVHAGA